MADQLDAHYMAQAIRLARRGRYTTSPNPNVGCVIVNNGTVVGEGWHQRAGSAHAEVYALTQAAEKASGATCYVTLEPCCHQGRTPPCTAALIKANVKRVVIGMLDPNPLVAGGGVKQLKSAGIEVIQGVCESQCREINSGFIHRMEKGRPLITCKMAASLDGATGLANGESKWITSSGARRDVQRFRAAACAILSTATTVIKDQASLNVRWQELGELQQTYPQASLRQPVRVIVDSQKRLSPDLELFKSAGEIWLATSSESYDVEFPKNVTTLVVDKNGAGIDLQHLMAVLAENQVNNVWVEAGAKFAGALLEQQLMDELIIYQAPKLLGSETLSIFETRIASISNAIDLQVKDIRMIGKDIRMTCNPLYEGGV